MNLTINVSPGELLDRLTILEIKLHRMHDPAQLANVKFEYDALAAVAAEKIEPTEYITRLRSQLKSVNDALWQVEEQIRAHERAQTFKRPFVGLARSVYLNNDLRAAIKKTINQHLGSKIVEEKDYATMAAKRANGAAAHG